MNIWYKESEDFMRKEIETKIRDRVPGVEGCKRLSAVLIPVIERESKQYLLLTQRALHMKHQPGDFCFPGGAREGNETPWETAVRETWEEIGIPPEHIRVVGETDAIVSSGGAYIRPVVGLIRDFPVEACVLNRDEVEKLLVVPLDFFVETQPDRYTINLKREFPEDFPFEKIVGGKNYKWGKTQIHQVFYDYQGNVIWGFTARVIDNFVKILTE